MENASKALLIAGGILISLLVVGALLLMINQLSYYQKSNSDELKDSQLLEFNRQFDQYTYSDIQGYELLTLINKVIDYNQKTPIGNSVDYSKKITITITGLNKFNEKYAYSDQPNNKKLFQADSYTIQYDDDDEISSQLEQALKDCIQAEGSLDTDELKSVSNLYSSRQSKAKNIETIRERLCELLPDGGYENWDGNTPLPTLDTIVLYRQYSEFKTSTFEKNGDPTYYDNGQIQSLSFKFKK